MKVARVSFERCQACVACPARKACRTKALIKMGPDEPVIVKPSDCMGCGACVEACPHAAVSMTES